MAALPVYDGGAPSLPPSLKDNSYGLTGDPRELSSCHHTSIVNFLSYLAQVKLLTIDIG